MTTSSMSKISKLSEAVQDRISQADILSELDNLDENFGIKSTTILVDLLVGDLEYGNLSEALKDSYGFNQFLADQIKARFGGLIEIIGQIISKKPEILNQSNNSHLTFSREDEEEVKKYRELPNDSGNLIDYEVEAMDIIGDLNLTLTDEVQVKRLRNIVVARLKEVRDDLETRENLMKSSKVGGMEFSEAQADSVLAAVKSYQAESGEDQPTNNYNAKISLPKNSAAVVATGIAKPEAKTQPSAIHIEEEDGLPVIKMPSGNLPMDLSEELPAVIPAKPSSFFKKSLPIASQNGKIKAETQSSSVTINQSPISNPTFNKLPPPSPAPYVASQHIPDTVLNSKTANKPNLDDVRFEKRLMGPVEELENMTMIDFRRLAADPMAAVGKIKEKIELLGQESFDRRIQGINAWHHNEVNKFYRLLGQAAMTEGKSIEDTIKERLLSGKPTLSIDELHAVIELNRTLRF